MAQSQKKQANKSKVGVGVGFGAAAALAAASYFLYGTKEGAKRRTQMRGWMMKAKGEVLDRMEKLTNIDEKKYRQLVEDVLKKYKKLNNVDPKEVKALADDLKKHWTRINRQMEQGNAQKKMAHKRAPKKSVRKR